ncbi:MAG: helix-turn-helix domain-containing protein [Thermoflexales bacterium]
MTAACLNCCLVFLRRAGHGPTDAANLLAGGAIALTPTEFKLLVALMRHTSDVLSPEELVREVEG